MNANAGWISTTPDLLRFVSAIHHKPTGLLASASIDTMVTKPDEPVSKKYHTSWYGCGWRVRQVGPDRKFNIWHDGALDGTSSLLVRRSDGLAWAVLFNTDFSTNERRLSQLIDPLLHITARSIDKLPEHDLFSDDNSE